MFRIPCAVFFAFMLLATAAAQQAAPSQRPVVGIALEGGGALGLAHIGVLRWMEEHRIPIDRLSGTSMGSLIGGLYASGSSPEDLRKIALGSDLQSVFTLETPYSASSFRRREDRRETGRHTEAEARPHRHLPDVADAELCDE